MYLLSVKRSLSYWWVILLLALIKFILPFVLQSPVYELQRDEYLYYQQGQHFDFGYLENPPLLSYLGMISYWLGGSVFWVKFWPSLFGALTVITACLITIEFDGKKFAQFVIGFGVMTGAYLRVHALFQPNILDVFFWTLSIYFIIRYTKTLQDKFLYAFAIAMALGFWSKYSVVFIAAAIAIGLLFTYHRKIFAKPIIYKALLLCIIIILPNITWQYFHNWPLVHHMRELQETQLQFLNPVDFIKDQLLMLMPVLIVWIGGLIWVFRKKEFRFLGWAYIFVIILLILGSGKSYYSLGVYPVLLAAGAAAWEKFSVTRNWLRYIIMISIIALTIPFIPVLLPVWKPGKLASFYQRNSMGKLGILKWEDRKDHSLPQDFADMLGWKELAEKTEKFFNSFPDSTKAGVVIYCRNYGQAGALKFYGTDDYFTSRVISDNGSFLLWIPDRLWFNHLIFIGRRTPDKKDEVFRHFRSATIIDSVTNIYSRQLGDKIIFFRDADKQAGQIAQEGLKEMKKEFSR